MPTNHEFDTWLQKYKIKFQVSKMFFGEISSENQLSWIYFLSILSFVNDCYCVASWLLQRFLARASVLVILLQIFMILLNLTSHFLAVICEMLGHNIIVDQRQTHSWAADAAAQHHCGVMRTVAGPGQE